MKRNKTIVFYSTSLIGTLWVKMVGCLLFNEMLTFVSHFVSFFREWGKRDRRDSRDRKEIDGRD